MKRRSIRFRLTWCYSAALTAGLALFGAAIWLSMRHSLLAEVDRTLADRTHKLGVLLNHELAADPTEDLREELDEYARVLPAGVLLQIRDSRGAVYFTSAVDFPFGGSVGPDSRYTNVNWQDRRYRVLTEKFLLDSEPLHIGIATSLETIEGLLNRLGWLVLACVPAVILAASFCGYWLSRRALKPVDEMTWAAHSIEIGNLSERLRVSDTGDELARLAGTWNEMLSRLEAAVKRLSQFTADAAHELRTPLAVIRSTAELAVRRPRSAEDYKDALQQIVTETGQMTQLVDDLLFLARCDSDSTEMPMRTLDLAPLVREICAGFGSRSESSAIRLSIGIPDKSFPISGNESALRRLVFALLDNAIKYSIGGGDIRIGIAESADGISLEVCDTGIGIPAPELPHIFERFYRAEDARVAANEGHGLGLSLAEGIAQRHRARIQVASVEGRGATFCVVFPVSVDSEWRPAISLNR
jgi:two-component system heavy metal sensor histidine kinase CusS